MTPEDKQRLAEQRAAEITKRRADFNATKNLGDKALRRFRRPFTRTRIPSSTRDVQGGGWNGTPP